jgi:hypothetical protein
MRIPAVSQRAFKGEGAYRAAEETERRNNSSKKLSPEKKKKKGSGLKN